MTQPKESAQDTSTSENEHFKATIAMDELRKIAERIDNVPFQDPSGGPYQQQNATGSGDHGQYQSGIRSGAGANEQSDYQDHPTNTCQPDSDLKRYRRREAFLLKH